MNYKAVKKILEHSLSWRQYMSSGTCNLNVMFSDKVFWFLMFNFTSCHVFIDILMTFMTFSIHWPPLYFHSIKIEKKQLQELKKCDIVIFTIKCPSTGNFFVLGNKMWNVEWTELTTVYVNDIFLLFYLLCMCNIHQGVPVRSSVKEFPKPWPCNFCKLCLKCIYFIVAIHSLWFCKVLVCRPVKYRLN